MIVVDGLDWEVFSRSNLPNLAWIRETGAVGLVSPGLARLPYPVANNWASFTAGDVINTRNPFIGLLNRQLAANGLADNVDVEHLEFAKSVGTDNSLQIDKVVGAWRVGRNADSTLVLCSITPPLLSGRTWNQLTPIAVCGFGYPRGSTLTSTTTRTRGLIALRDLAPTILSLAGAPIPISMSGTPMTSVYLRNRELRLDRMERVTELDQAAIVPLSWFLGVAAFFAIFGGARVAEAGLTEYGKLVCYLLRVILCTPLALLLAPCFPLTNLGAYIVVIISLVVGLALIPSTCVILIATSLVILGDGLSGSSMIAASVISGYWLSGIRFYGIGNEYMGVLIGMSLLAPVLLRQSAYPKLGDRTFSMLVGGFYLAVVFVLSYPAFGAKAGGAVTSVAALGPAWYAITFRKRPTWITLTAASVCGFVLVFAMSDLADLFHSAPSHIQTAIAAVHHGRLGYIKSITIRKAKMAVKTVLTPGGIAAIIGLIPLWFFWTRSRLRDRITEFLKTRSDLSIALAAGYWALLAALLFNDSGSVAFLFFFGAMSIVLLHELVKSECVFSR